MTLLKVKGKGNPYTGLDRPWGFQEIEAPRFQDNWHMKMVKLSALRTGRFNRYEICLVLISVRGWVNPQGHSASGRTVSIKSSTETVRNRTLDLQDCNVVPHPTAPPPLSWVVGRNSSAWHLHRFTIIIRSNHQRCNLQFGTMQLSKIFFPP